MNNQMDRVCKNCGERCGAHFGNNPLFCRSEDYIQFRKDGRVVIIKTFVNSGKLRTRDGGEYIPENMTNNPNILFKRKKRNDLR